MRLAVPPYHRRLPHIYPEGAWLFITFRLHGSLPNLQAQSFVDADRIMDRAAAGPRWLADPRIAAIVAEAIHAGARAHDFYDIRAWVLMINHIHLLILPKVAVPKIMQWLKGSTSHAANALLNRAGERFWQIESYDHWIRDRWELEKTVRYIEENPVSAGLVTSAAEWPWSSGAWQAKACAT